ncbi:MAG TPA: hypothetical protein VJ868_10480 [Actinomycetota bacterium]|nr:hypothetical protein [Actinomycetota bacterium]
MRKPALWLVCAAVLAGGCARPGPENVSHPRLEPLEGAVHVLRAGEVMAASAAMDLQPGDVVRTRPGGRALLRFPGAQWVEVAPEAEVAVGDSGPELVTGSALVRASTGLSIRVGEVAVRADRAVYRLDRDVATRVGVYDGGVSLPGSGLEGDVARLREAVVTAGIVTRQPGPLTLDPRDPWDTRLLGEAIDLGLDLERYEAGLAHQFPARGVRDTLEAALPRELPARRALSMIRGVSPAGGLVASVVATQLSEAHAIPALSALRRVVEELRLGASWSVVVAQWELARAALETALGRVSDLVVEALSAAGPSAREEAGRRGGSQSGPAGGGSSSAGDSGGSSTSSSGGGTSSGGGSTGGGGGGTGGGGGGGGGEPPPPGCGNLIECTVEDILGDDGLGLGGGGG